jgi:uroporphyrinogen-III synthase
VAVTRDEPADGPLSSALAARGLRPVACPVMVEQPPADPGALEDAARSLDTYDWVVVASARSVRAISDARQAPWPPDMRTAAVGAATAAALADAGVRRPVVVAADAGAAALAALLDEVDWADQRVLVPTTPGGHRLLADHLRAAWALVDEIEVYAMRPRDPHDIQADWHAAAPDAAVLASARTADRLVAAIGANALARLRSLVAIGAPTAAALAPFGLSVTTAPRADFASAADVVAARRDAEARR